MAAGVREVGSGELMRPRRLDTAINERLHHIWVGPLRPAVVIALSWGQIGDMTQRIVPAGSGPSNGTVDRASEQLAAEICHYMPS
ncbi:hypothetical protein MGALJ_39430 [Mycobacterium gallinarum]|uniref:Uncharacterized protein n=1 Tax=Mycobacterium gallinarum TaxID=39689 RepID=A0A9W4BL45_9MYCO|nr:hypothetical protein MGALJ_39430 [Mycobacterium gallinarum]